MRSVFSFTLVAMIVSTVSLARAAPDTPPRATSAAVKPGPTETTTRPADAPRPKTAPTPGQAPQEVPKPDPRPILRTTLAGGKVEVWVKAQLRDRFETTGRKDLELHTRSELISQRSRLGLGVRLFSQYEVFAQVQDVRLWGSETDTLGDFSANGFDLHQAWAQVKIWRGLYLRIGRQELAYDDQRLVGTVDWSQQGRSFDAARLWWRGGPLRAEAFYARTREKDGDDTVVQDKHFFGVWLKLVKLKLVQPSLILLTEIDWNEGTDRHRETLGTRVHGGWKGLSYDLAFYYQLGHDDLNALNYSAYLFAGRVGYRAPLVTKPGVLLWAELVSGDGDPDDRTIRSFDTLFATNHKFYGLMDFFLNLPNHTGGGGLQDFGGRLYLAPVAGLWVAADYHYFRLMERNAAGDQSLGHEIDFTVRYRLRRWVSVQAGYSALVPGAALASLKGGQSHSEHWFYLQTDVAF